ncbi:MAG: hypothetical protein E4G96_08455 [Chrysiogenales bacterium]|nr:MAG: hypothetical protein E4G96_08455 [Chrysiogenales bacterium]
MPSKPKRVAAKKKKAAVKPKKKSPLKQEVKSTRTKTKKVNLLKLYAEMNKLSHDAVDKEVIKRFKIIIDTIEEDITKKSLLQILRDQKSVIASEFGDALQPYIKHYLFLDKRSKRVKKP